VAAPFHMRRRMHTIPRRARINRQRLIREARSNRHAQLPQRRAPPTETVLALAGVWGSKGVSDQKILNARIIFTFRRLVGLNGLVAISLTPRIEPRRVKHHTL
jgi:hypothetical protein